MNQLSQQKPPVKPDHNFRLSFIFDAKVIVIFTQGRFVLSYKQLLSVIALFTILGTTGMPILSKFLQFPTNQSQEINQNNNIPQ